MFLGFAVTQHCNLRCPHCIRDDVTTVRSLPLPLLASVVDQARALWDDVEVSLTGGEPMIHPEFSGIVEALRERGVPWRMVSNGWHLKRILPLLERYPPRFVRLSLSGATAEVHDAERGRGSFARVLLAVGLLRSRGIPASLSIVIDRRDRHQLREAAELADAVGAMDVHYILPQPVTGSAERDTDLRPEEWLPIRREIEALAAEPARRAAVVLDYGAPSDGPEASCATMRLERLYVDAHGRLASCCQLSDYGANEAEVVADLNTTPLADAWSLHRERMEALRAATRPVAADPFAAFPCIRCIRACGKAEWLRDFPASPWAGAAEPLPSVGRRVPVPAGGLVSLGYARRAAADADVEDAA